MTNTKHISRAKFLFDLYGDEYKLTLAVLRQLGGKWTEVRENLIDCANHGADSGFGGFTYTLDCVLFFQKNRPAIRAILKETASEFGEDLVEMVANFRYVKSRGISKFAIGSVVFGDGSDCDELERRSLEENLAWFAFEHVARLYQSQIDG